MLHCRLKPTFSGFRKKTPELSVSAVKFWDIGRTCTYYVVVSELSCCHVTELSKQYLSVIKPKQKLITLANHKRNRQYGEPIKTPSNYM